MDRFSRVVAEQERKIRDKAADLVEAGYEPYRALQVAKEIVMDQYRMTRKRKLEDPADGR